MIWREFKAMGTDIIIVIEAGTEFNYHLNEFEGRIIDFENKFSRFLPDSELSKFNNDSKETFLPSESFIEILNEVKNYYLKTEGIFDPTIIENLESVGYKNSFDEIKNDEDIIDFKDLNTRFNNRSKIADLIIDKSAIIRPTNFKIDLGGIGKGYIVDQLGRTILANHKNYWISAGGDILASGSEKEKTGWNIGVQNPHNPEEDLFTINTKGKKLGIATSGIIKRNGLKGDFKWHHLIDPRTGLPAVNEILSVTVISSSAVKADVLAKTLLILGVSEALNFIEKETDSAAIIFVKNGPPIFSQRAYSYIN